MHTNPTLAGQPRNLTAAIIGALAGLASLAPLATHSRTLLSTPLLWYLQHEPIVTAAAVAALILSLSHIKQQRPKATVLCCLLGLACTRLTISLIQ